MSKYRLLASFGIALLCFLFILNFPASSLYSQGLRVVTKPLISGHLNISPALLAVFLVVTSGGTKITSLTVRVDDTYNVPYTADNMYNATIGGYGPLTYNKAIKISIRSPLPTDPQIFVNGRVSALADFIEPTPTTAIDLRTTAFVKVRWRYSAGSATVQDLILTREGGGGSASFTGIGAATNYEIPRDRLLANSTYGLTLRVILNDFKFKDPGLVDPSSRISLLLYIRTSFRTAP